jgi:hypothetical protein
MPIDPLVPKVLGYKPLGLLAADIQVAREEVRRLRRGPVAHDRLLAARQTLLRAMEAYAEELTVRHLPIPRKLRDDLRLQHSLRRERGAAGPGR